MVGKAKPLARALRTFAVGMTGVLGTALLVDWNSATYADVRPIVLGTIVAAVAGVSSFLLALTDYTADTAIGRAAASFLQVFGSGIVTFGIADLTTDAGIAWAQAAGALAVTAVIAAALSLATNAAEDGSATEGPVAEVPGGDVPAADL